MPSEEMDLLIESLAGVAHTAEANREGILEVVLEAHAEHHGPSVPVALLYIAK